jgi:hypothetical protein
VAKTAAAGGLNTVGSVTNKGFETASVATKGIFKGVMEATRALEQLTLGNLFISSSTAFVTFNSRVVRIGALQMLLSVRYPNIVVQRSPSPADLVWQNVPKPVEVVNARRSLSSIILGMGAILWGSVVVFVNAISNLDELSKKYTWIDDYSDTVVYSLVNSYLAVVLLLLLIALQPFVFDAISRYYCYTKSESLIQEDIMSNLFYYQVMNVYISIVSGSIFSSLNRIISEPTSFLTFLGSSLPSVSIYFSVLVVVKTFSALPIEMLRIGPWISTFFLTSCLDKKKCTRRELRRYFAPPPFLAGWEYPGLLMVYLISLAYATIAPLLQVFPVVFFGMSYVMYKYQLLYVYVTPWQAGGEMWFAAFDRSMVCLMLSCFALMGYMAIVAEGDTITSGPFYAMLPLLLLINYFWSHCNTKFKKLCHCLGVASARELDQATPNPEESYPLFHDCSYRQPALSEPCQEPEPYRMGGHNTMAATLALGATTDHVHGMEEGMTLNSPDRTEPLLPGGTGSDVGSGGGSDSGDGRQGRHQTRGISGRAGATDEEDDKDANELLL